MKSIDLYDDGIGKVELVDSVGTDLTIVNSARVSFGVHKEDLDDKDKKLIRYLIKHKHTSTLEHCFVTFRVKVPLFIRSQHHRHRTWSYNEISRRMQEPVVNVSPLSALPPFFIMVKPRRCSAARRSWASSACWSL